MSKPSESTGRALPRPNRIQPPRVTGLRVGILLAATLLLVAPARAGLTSADTGAAPATTPAELDTAAAATPLYQLRCWQHGQLLFEEHLARLPGKGASLGLRISGTDRNQRPVYVAETQNAICLIRSVAIERGWPRGGN